MKLTNRKIAETLRKIARQVERGEPTPYPGGQVWENRYTCNRVYAAFACARDREFGKYMEYRYTAAFEFEGREGDEEFEGYSPELWADPDRDELRVLFLCFAAALAETGDL